MNSTLSFYDRARLHFVKQMIDIVEEILLYLFLSKEEQDWKKKRSQLQK